MGYSDTVTDVKWSALQTELAGSERHRQGKQRYLAWEQSHQDKNGPFGLCHSQQIYFCLLQKKSEASFGRQKKWSPGQNTSDMVCQKHFSAPHFHWCVKWHWGGAAPQESLMGRNSPGKMVNESPETHLDITCYLFLYGESFCFTFSFPFFS